MAPASLNDKYQMEFFCQVKVQPSNLTLVLKNS